MGMKGPRMMRVYLPLVDQSGRMLTMKPQSDKDYLQNLYKSIDRGSDVFTLENKPPCWSSKFNTYMLDFNFRVTQGSPKNFQLVNPLNRKYYYSYKADKTILQFGKISDGVYTMDVQYPLSPFQSFAICLSSLATKVLCE
jgi:tubby-related protein 1